jgi:nucleotide-binding universal stress UspA family protein
MTAPESPHLAAIKKVFHPSDFTEASQLAFRHALKIALVCKAEFTVLHVAEHEGAHWSKFPGVRQWLERWRLIPPGSGRDAVKALGLAINKVVAHSNDILRACLYYLDRHPTDLVVLTSQQRESLAGWPQVEGLSLDRCPMTLFLREATEGFVYASDGGLQIRRILVPIAVEPDPQTAVTSAARFAHALGLERADFILLHIGEPTSVPEVRTPAMPGWTWRCDVRDREVAEAILAASTEHSVDLVVMATDGEHGFLDALRGKITERIVHEGHCPVLAVPGESGS